jgi:single-strand DNA-binding protein
MPYLNDCKIMGHLGRDPELSYSQTGTAICKFSVAVSRGKDKDTDWFNVVCFGKSAEIAVESLSKGSLVLALGSMQASKYNEKTYWTLVANRVYALGKNINSGQRSQGAADWSDVGAEIGGDDDDIPF